MAGYTPASANRRTVVAIMIETPEGVAHADEILAVPGIDAVYVGPSDLAVGLGLTPPAHDPEHERLIEAVAAACRRHGVVAGIHCGSVEDARRWREHGFQMLNVGSDAALLQGATRSVVQSLKGEVPTGAAEGV